MNDKAIAEVEVDAQPEPSQRSECSEKLQRVRGFLEVQNLDGALFTHPNHVGWVTGGLQDVIIRGTNRGFVWALVTPADAYLVTQNIEAPRLVAEEGAAALGFEVVSVPWESEPYDARVGELCDPERLANDGSGPGRPMPTDLQELRLVLTADEQERLRRLGRDACGALEGAVAQVGPGMAERELAAAIVHNLELEAIVADVLLVGSDERRAAFRHPTVSAATIERDVAAVIVGVRGGLNIALTRSASIGPADEVFARRHAVARTVEANMIAATVPGATYGQALQAGIDAYDDAGYPGEWRHHYQGGPIAYGTREFGPTPLEHPNAGTAHPIAQGHACAWNPTVQGAKSEDTFIVGADGPELITNVSDWPAVDVETAGGRAVRRPVIREIG